ncbi:BREX-3 system P-loop-containing protein BrxF [Photobacterium leiognathi]|uniref:BREX-3 system P-loop-containing protein BrxF n=1 Tax=Photobacterium leiognathi TaxID=553611 RepID=UPI0029818E27|nr:BREX-3 system P-loop-containing protein BrxF [Photobacterium leiognathi]
MNQITSSLKDELIRLVARSSMVAECCSYSLVLVVLEHNVRESLEKEIQNNEIKLINVSKSLSQRIVSLSIKERIKRLDVEFEEIVQECNENIWLTKLDLLFEPSLKADPILLLKWLSKSQPIVAIWPGQIYDKTLVYAKPGSEDYRTYSLQELKDIQVIKACNGVIK